MKLLLAITLAAFLWGCRPTVNSLPQPSTGKNQSPIAASTPPLSDRNLQASPFGSYAEERPSFISSCRAGFPEQQCICYFERIQANYTYPQFLETKRYWRETGNFPPDLVAAVDGCEIASYQNQNEPHSFDSPAWQGIVKTTMGDVVLVDTESLSRQGTNVSYWVLVVFPSPQLGVKSLLSRVTLNCQTRNYQTNDARSLSADSQLINRDTTLKTAYAAPNSVDDAVLQFVCRR